MAISFFTLWSDYEMLRLEGTTNPYCVQNLRKLFEEPNDVILNKTQVRISIRASLLNRKFLMNLDYVLGELLREETGLQTQAIWKVLAVVIWLWLQTVANLEIQPRFSAIGAKHLITLSPIVRRPVARTATHVFISALSFYGFIDTCWSSFILGLYF